MKETPSTCCYCGTGCGVIIESDGHAISGVRGDPAHPANFGRLCTKGSTLHLSARHDARALHPELRQQRDGVRRRVKWKEALDFVAQRFAALIERYGPDSVAFYISGQLLTEDYYVFNKLAKGLIGTNNIDTNSRLCMSSAVAGYKATLGADAPPCCYEDIAQAQCLFIVGSNTAYAHPIVFRRIEEARAKNPQMRIIVADPRRTDTASIADIFLPILPGSDVALFHGMLHVMLWEGLCDPDYIARHTEGFDALKETVREYTPQAVATICGVPAADIVTAAKWFGGSGASLSLYCQGLNQSVHGTDKNAALINLHLATGMIGKPGAGPFSLTGQPNAMGGREVGGMANLLSAHRDLANPIHRAEVAKMWGVPEVPAMPGKTAVEMFEAVRRGEIKALWIACTNPVHSLPDAGSVRAALSVAELVVVQDAYRNIDTADYADVLLPATSWGEKEGTVTNSERRISRVRRAVAGPGSSRADWDIAADFARRLARYLGKAEPSFAYQMPEQIFNEHRATTVGRDLDIGGLSYALLEQRGPQQWPFPMGATVGRQRLYEDGVFPTPSARARFANVAYLPVAEATDARYPLHFNTGRLRDQWHGMSRTGTVARLYSHDEEPILEMHADDMARRRLVDGDVVRVSSRRGELAVRVAASAQMRPGQVFLAMHWGSRTMNGAGANALTITAFDAVSRQPELKHAAVQVEKVELPWRMVAMRKGDTVARMARVQPLLRYFGYATCGLYGHGQAVLVLRTAHDAVPDAALLAEIDAALELNEEHAVTYADARRGVTKRALLRDGKVEGVRLAGEVAAAEWLKDWMARDIGADGLRAWLLAPLATPPSGAVSRGRIVCNCHDVAESEIVAEVKHGSGLAALQAKLKCGTACGSCVPELKRLCAQPAAV
ncbi:MAG: molybdopterin-dependent oxidoreductase [Pseudomonadota bacterium]